MADDRTGPKYQLGREMLREELRDAVAGRPCTICDRTTHLVLRWPLSVDQSRRLGTEAWGATLAFFYICRDCLGRGDLDVLIREAIDRGVADRGRQVYDLGALEPPGGY